MENFVYYTLCLADESVVWCGVVDLIDSYIYIHHRPRRHYHIHNISISYFLYAYNLLYMNNLNIKKRAFSLYKLCITKKKIQLKIH